MNQNKILHEKFTKKFLALFSLCFVFLLFPALSFANPVIFYTDIVSGPNTGGENNNGAYLTLFGRGFGALRGTSKVYINSVEVASYKYWSDTKVSVQPGPNVTSGVIKLVVDGRVSNSDQTFAVRPGDIYFVSLTGSDTGGAIGDISQPFRGVQATLNRSDFDSGDIIVVRGGTWTDVGTNGTFFRVDKSGTSTDPLMVIGYPGESVFVNHAGTNGAIRLYNTSGGVVIANLKISTNGHGCIDLSISTQYVRVVNNEVYGMDLSGGGAGCIAGNGKHYKLLGNAVHDNGSTKLYHAIYFDNRDDLGSDDIEIAYNHIYNQTGGRGIQIYHGSGSGITNITIHDNIIHDIALDGITLGNSSETGFLIYNNVIYRTGVPSLQADGSSGGCIRLNSSTLVVEVYNNTFYDCDVDTNSGLIRLEAASHVTLKNNIINASSGEHYFFSTIPDTAITASNNLWYGSGGLPAWDSSSINSNPLLVSVTALDFRLQIGSPAINSGASVLGVTRDKDGISRPIGNSFDIGAYEYGVDVTPPAKPTGVVVH